MAQERAENLQETRAPGDVFICRPAATPTARSQCVPQCSRHDGHQWGRHAPRCRFCRGVVGGTGHTRRTPQPTCSAGSGARAGALRCVDRKERCHPRVEELVRTGCVAVMETLDVMLRNPPAEARVRGRALRCRACVLTCCLSRWPAVRWRFQAMTPRSRSRCVSALQNATTAVS